MPLTENNVYPNISELMPEPLLAMVPVLLARDIETRYASLGTKYLTEERHTDGRQINALMYTSRVANANEEIVDAFFCMLGTAFKATVNEEEIPDWVYEVMTGLIHIYGVLKMVEVEDLAAAEGLVDLA